MNRLLTGDCRTILLTLDVNSIDAVVTDPPYDLTTVSRGGSPRTNNPETPFGRHRLQSTGGFMGQRWDSTGVAFDPKTWETVLRVMKPGAYLLAFGGTRTYHRLTCAIEDAGFEIKDCLMWIYGTGMKKHDHALKPAWEPIIMAQKPRAGSYEKNIERWGVGGLRIDDCRIGANGGCAKSDDERGGPTDNCYGDGLNTRRPAPRIEGLGRWPANLILDEEAAVLLDVSVNPSHSRIGKPRQSALPGNGWGATKTGAEYDDAGGPSRFFYVAKASRKERDAGLDDRPLRLPAAMVGNLVDGQRLGGNGTPIRTPMGRNPHPTVKPIALMRYLTRLVTPQSGLVLDPFTGSGSTGCACGLEGMDFLGIDENPEYVEIAERRIEHWSTR